MSPSKTNFSHLILYCDGASRGNPGPGAYGFIIWEDAEVVAKAGARIGDVTNNIAEYSGLIAGLKKCLELGAKRITVRSDSELLVRQLNGIYKVRAPGILPLFEEARTLLGKFPEFEVTHVPREENKDADKLANLALDRLL